MRHRGKSYPASGVHKEFESLIESLTPTENTLRDLGERLIRAIDRRHAEQEFFNARRRDSVKGLNRQLDELIKMRTQGLVNDEEFIHQKKIILSRRYDVESKNVPVDDLEEVRTTFSALVTPLVRLRETREAMNPAIRRRFDRIMLPVGFKNKNSRTAELGLVFSTIGKSAHSDSPEVALSSEKLNHIIAEIQAFWNILKDIEMPDSESKEPVRLSSPEWTSGENVEPIETV